MNIGEKLIKLRKEKNISQEKLSNKLGITRQTLSNWESNLTSPNLEQTKKLSQIFNISIDELVDDNTILMLNKLNNTEDLVIKQNKNIKIILLTIYTLIIISLLIFSFKMFTKKDFTNKYSTEFKCTLKNETYSFDLYYSGKTENFNNAENPNGEENYTYYIEGPDSEGYNQKIKAGNSLYEAYKSLELLKKYYINHGAICTDIN